MSLSGEPSVEDILASIKKVIAEDQRPAETAPAAAGGTDEILDLGAENALADEAENPGETPPLVTTEAREHMRESLAALSVMTQPGASPQIVRSGETSLEDLTRDLLRPALAAWLDKNLPPLVERMVSAEIARIVGKKA